MAHGALVLERMNGLRALNHFTQGRQPLESVYYHHMTTEATDQGDLDFKSDVIREYVASRQADGLTNAEIRTEIKSIWPEAEVER